MKFLQDYQGLSKLVNKFDILQSLLLRKGSFFAVEALNSNLCLIQNWPSSSSCLSMSPTLPSGSISQSHNLLIAKCDRSMSTLASLSSVGSHKYFIFCVDWCCVLFRATKGFVLLCYKYSVLIWILIRHYNWFKIIFFKSENEFKSKIEGGCKLKKLKLINFR